MSFNTELTKQLDLWMEDVLLHWTYQTLGLTGLINGRCPLTLNLPNNWTYQWKMSFYTELNKQLDLSKMSFNTELELNKQLGLSMEDVL